jgi:predicted HTH domain antitoxin
MSSVISKGADALVRGKFYSTKNELFEDALKTFFEFRKDMRVAAVVELYKTDEMSLSKAAELAGVSTEEMKDHLAKAGVRLRRGFSKDKGKELAMLIR